MKKLIKHSCAVFTIALVAANHSIAQAGDSLLPVEMNSYLQRCYQQTELAIKIEDKSSLSVQACNKVLHNRWLTKEAEANTRFNRGLIYLYKDDLDKALRDFTRALKVEPNLYQAHVAIAKILFARKQFKQSKQHFEMALKFNQDDQSLIAANDYVGKKLK